MMTGIKSLNLALAFILELAMLAAFLYWGFHTGESTIAKLLLGIGVPLIVAGIWGIFMAPNSSRHLEGAAYLAVKTILFGLAVTALVVAEQRTAGIVLAVVFVINTVLLYVWR